MKKINVEDRAQIKQLLYGHCVLGVKDDRYRSFGGFQLWWYNKEHDSCSCCESSWSDPRKRVRHYNLDESAKILWHHRKSLYCRTKHVSEDSGLNLMERGEIESWKATRRCPAGPGRERPSEGI